MSLNCTICGARLRVVIHGGEFLIREGSTLDNINFEKQQKVDIMHATTIDDDTMLQVQIECSMDPTHAQWATSLTRIKQDIYQRIEMGARRLRAHNL